MDSQTNTISSNSIDDNINMVKSSLYPESLENSKVIGFLNENFSFNLEDLYNQKEFKKAFESKEIFIKVIEQIEFLKMDNNHKNCTIQINDDMKIYSLINVPAKMTREDLIKELNLNGKNYFSRIYKKYFVWLLVAENNNNDKFEEILKKIYFGEERLKFDITLGANLKKLILKRINYNKESSDLKANTKVDNNLSVNNPEAGSWRKKSNDGEDNFNTKKFVQIEKNNANNGNNFKRKRFNSDAGANDNPSNENIFSNVIEKIVPSDKIKFRYSIKEMVDFFNFSTAIFNIQPKFSNLIEELCIEHRRKYIPLFQDLVNENKRDRSKTINFQAYEFSGLNQKAINLPKNNPLQDFSNYDYNNKQYSKNNYSSNIYKNKFDFAN